MKLSTYEASNIDEITQLFLQTFTESEDKEQGETVAHLAKGLMTTTPTNELSVFIASDNETIFGAIIFTPLKFTESSLKASLLSPVAIHSQHQGKGLGQQLINFGLKTLKEQGVEIALTYGDPTFYSKVGFEQISETIIKSPQRLSFPEGWLAQSLTTAPLKTIASATTCAKALDDPTVW